MSCPAKFVGLFFSRLSSFRGVLIKGKGMMHIFCTSNIKHFAVGEQCKQKGLAWYIRMLVMATHFAGSIIPSQSVFYTLTEPELRVSSIHSTSIELNTQFQLSHSLAP